MNIRKAKVADVNIMRLMINSYARKGMMLERSLNELYENLRDYFVADESGKVVGCCALHIGWNDLAEIKSLAVEEKSSGKGIGRELVIKCIEEAGDIGVNKVFALTYKPDFFRKLKFKPINKEELPHKIWNECVNCPKFPDCDEEALIIELNNDR